VLFVAMGEIGAPLHLACALSLLFAFSEEVWAMANVTEVYGIAAFMVCIICLLLPKRPSLPLLFLVAYAFGIGVTAHYTVGLMCVGLGWWFYRSGRRLGKPSLRQWLAIVLFCLVGFSMTLYLIVRAKAQPLIAWEDPQTWGRFWQVIARLRYGSIALAQGGAPPLSLQVIFQKLLFFLKVMADDLTWLGLIAFALGLWRCMKDRDLGWTLVLLLLGSGPGFLILANVGLSQATADLMKRFFFLSFIFAILIMARGLKDLPAYVTTLVFLAPAFLLFSNFSVLNHRQEYLFYDYGKNILRSLPPRTLLLSDRADEMEFALAYLHLAEGKRPDVDFIDCNAGVSRSIYGDDYYRIWGKPRLARREKVENEMIRTADRPVYYATFVPDMIAIPRFQEGLVYRAKPAGQQAHEFSFAALYSLRTGGIESIDERAMSLVLSQYQLLGQYYLSMGDAANADRQFDALAVNDASGRWTSNIGFLYHQKGMIALAEKYYLLAIEKGKENSEIYTNLGAIYESQGQRARAQEMYLAALRLDPDSVQSHYNLAVLHWRDGDWQAVADEFGKVLELAPGNVEARNYRAQALQRLKEGH
jgi:tetratricopeptide (TPR) repeat protein